MNNTMGLNGGPSKCARFYVDMMECAKAAGRNDHFLKCKNEREDYNECLHNRKLSIRQEKIKREKKRLIKEGRWPPKPENSTATTVAANN